jgi:uncharacterized protein (TIGR03067 family)
MNDHRTTCDPERIELFLQQKLSDEEQSAFESHLDDCRECRRRLETAAAKEEVWSGVRESLQDRQFSSDIGQSGESTVDRAKDDDSPTGHETVLGMLSPTDDDRMLGRLGSYEIVGVVGSGGMGVVLKAFDAALNRYVAIKALAPHLGNSGAARKRFMREAQAAAAVVHENVMEIYGVADTKGLSYLVMPYVRGPSLQRRLDDNGPLALVEILRIGMQAASGLAAAHAQGLIHRDVKPANILLADGVERVKLTDFGLARAVDDASLTKTGFIAGTPQYMSPEQARGEPLDHQSDLFSLGSVLYAMCTGRAPFRAETSYGVLRRITDEEPRPIREINAEIPDWHCWIVGKLMSKKPDERFGSAEEVAKLLEECLSHVQQPTGVPLPSAIPRPATRTRSKRRNIFRKGVIVMFATFGVALLGMMLAQITDPPEISGTWSSEETGQLLLDRTSPGEYSGSYQSAVGKTPGKIDVSWSRLQRRFNGTWREGDDCFGELSLRLVDNELRGARTTDPKSKVDPATPRLADFVWKRAETATKHESQWSLTRDFSREQNPNGCWSYGWTPGLAGQFTLLTKSQGGGFTGWFRLLAENPLAVSRAIKENDTELEQTVREETIRPIDHPMGGPPAVVINDKKTTLEGVAPGEVNMHPGPTGEHAVTRWTAPRAGHVSVRGKFGAGNSGLVDVRILRNGISLFSVLNTEKDEPFTLEIEVWKGDAIDFAVGAGRNGNSYGATPVEAAIMIDGKKVEPADSAVDLAALKGEWKVVEFKKGDAAELTWNENQPPECAVHLDKAKAAVFFNDDDFSFLEREEGNGDFCFSFKIDPHAMPKTIEIDNGLVATGIYELAGNKLKLCLRKHIPALKENTRPQNFLVGPNSRDVLFVLERNPNSPFSKIRPSEGEPVAVDPAKNPESLQGQWKVAKVEIDKNSHWFKNDMTLSPPEFMTFIIFEEGNPDKKIPNTMTYDGFGRSPNPHRKEICTYRIDPTATPKRIEMFDPRDSGKPDGDKQVALGIYEFQDDMMKLCWRMPEPGEKNPQYPQSFSATPNSLVVHLERYAPSKDEKALQGDWIIVSETGKMLLGRWPLQGRICSFHTPAIDFTDERSHSLFNGQFELIETAEPKEIRITSFSQESVQREIEKVKLNGIYKLDGNRLTIAYRTDKPTPAKFESGTDSDVTLLELQRLEPKPSGDVRPSQSGTVSEMKAPDESKNSMANPVADLKAMHGVWNVVRQMNSDAADTLWNDNKGTHFDVAKLSRAIFQNEKLHVRNADLSLWVCYKFQIDPVASPPRIDIFSEQNKDQLIAVGIYEFEGDKLKICIAKYQPALKADQRPKSFAVDAKSGNLLLTLETSADFKALHGNRMIPSEWKLVSETRNGEIMPTELPIDLTSSPRLRYPVYFNYDYAVFSTGKQCAVTGSYFLEENKYPKKIQFHFTLLAGISNQGVTTKDIVFRGIYKLEGDRLTIAYREDDKPLENFESTSGSGITLLELQRGNPPQKVSISERPQTSKANDLSSAMDRFLAGSLPYRVPFELGATNLRGGDRITIEEVNGTADEIKPGNMYEVKGTYRLASRDSAMLAAYVTVDSRDSKANHAPSLKTQTTTVKRGEGKFTLLFYMWGEGKPHLSFYSENGGDGLGGIYFGTGDSVLRKGWWEDRPKDEGYSP